MAISKNRLEELISQEATIYSARIKVREISLNDLIQIYTEHGEDVIVFGYEPNDWEELKDLFETRKEAEWHLKYHVTRTEELNLPTWEEFKNSKVKWISFWSKTYDTYWLYLRYNKIRLTRILDDGYESVVQIWVATEENYIKACDLCIKLFKEGI